MEGGPTVFIVSQRASSIRHADKIIVLDDGEAVGIGTHEELLETLSGVPGDLRVPVPARRKGGDGMKEQKARQRAP